MNTLSHLFAMASALHTKRQWIGGQQGPMLQPLHPFRDTPAAKQPAAGPAHGLAAMAARAAVTPDPETQLHLTAEQHDHAESGGADVWEDTAVLTHVQSLQTPHGVSPKERARVMARAARYSWQQGKLYKKWDDGTLREVPPPAGRLSLVRQHHEQLGHFGVKRTVSLLLHNYWWQGLTKLVKQLVSACALCSRSNTTFNRPQPQLQSLPISGPGFRWHLDLAGPFPQTAKGFVYVLVAVEAFTKWVVLVPLPNKQPDSTAQAYHSAVYAYFGGCAQLVTDQGGEWEGRFQQLMQRLCIDHRTTSAYRPQSNGQAEKTVQTVKRSLKKSCAAAVDKLAWDQHLPAIMLGYNCSRQAATKLSPYQLMYGATPMLPAQLKDAFSVVVDPTEEQAAAVYWQRAQQLAEYGWVAWPNLLAAQHRDQLWYAKVRSGNHLTTAQQLAPGMLVYLKTLQPTGLSLPAQPIILQVVKVGPSGVVTLQGSDGNLTKRHASHLAPCHLPNVSPVINRQLQVAPEEQCCVSCGSPERGDVMLLCDACGSGHHTFCLDPPLNEVPPGTWLCPQCTAAGITKEQVEQQQEQWGERQAVQVQQERLTPSMQQAAALQGRWVRHHQPGAKGWRGKVCFGQLSLLGVQPGKQPRLQVTYQNGQQEQITVRGCNTRFRQLLPEGEVPPQPLVEEPEQESLSAAMGSISSLLSAPQPQHAASIAWLQNNPWEVDSKSHVVRQQLLEVLPRVLQPATANWAVEVWLAPNLARWKQHVQALCWWSTVSVLPRHGPPPAPRGMPLLLCIDNGSTMADLLEHHRTAKDSVVLCVMQRSLRQLQRQGLAAMDGVVLQQLGTVECSEPWAIWSYPPWQQLSWAVAVQQLAAVPPVRAGVTAHP
jgi:transposase InsO family protein